MLHELFRMCSCGMIKMRLGRQAHVHCLDHRQGHMNLLRTICQVPSPRWSPVTVGSFVVSGIDSKEELSNCAASLLY